MPAQRIGQDPAGDLADQLLGRGPLDPPGLAPDLAVVGQRGPGRQHAGVDRGQHLVPAGHIGLDEGVAVGWAAQVTGRRGQPLAVPRSAGCAILPPSSGTTTTRSSPARSSTEDMPYQVLKRPSPAAGLAHDLQRLRTMVRTRGGSGKRSHRPHHLR